MLVSSDVRPESTVYYCGGEILRVLSNNAQGLPLVDLYGQTKAKGIGSASFLLGLDWLYLLDAISVSDKGEVRCS